MIFFTKCVRGHPVPLRSYQLETQQAVLQHWQKGHRRVMPVLPTGSGKTKIMSATAVLKVAGTLGLAMAHRGELVGQISLALAKEGLQHTLIASKGDIRTICDMHQEELGKVMYNPTAEWMVASVDTLNRRNVNDWSGRVSMAFLDEAHHVLRDNKWGRAVDLFPNAYWMLPTATSVRADGRGLGSHASGVVDAVVPGPSLAWMIDQGFLTDFAVRQVVPTDLDLSHIERGADGDYKKPQVSAATKRSRSIVGDVVGTYIEHTPGKLGIVFAVDLEHAQKITDEFNARGVPAAFLSGDSSTEERRRILRDYRNRKIHVLVNVDLFGEGFDLPAIEVVMFARATASYALYVQMTGRGLRLQISDILMGAWDTFTPQQRKAHIAASEKPICYIHDHVGNINHFNGPPTIPYDVFAGMDDIKRSAGKANDVPMRRCIALTCQEAYERFLPRCPYCGTEPPPPAVRGAPIDVDGDLTLYTREMLESLYGVSTVEAVTAKADQALAWCPIPPNVAPMVVAAIKNQHARKVEAQGRLREAMMLAMPGGEQDRYEQRRFFHQFGTDVLGAKLLGASDADALREKIIAKLGG